MQKILDNYKKVVPFVVLSGLIISFGLYFTKIQNWQVIQNWVYLATIAFGILPFVIEMLRSFIHKDFGVDLIAVVGIVAAVILKEYLSAAIILLMLSGGEYLESSALRQARKEITKLLKDNPQSAHLEIDTEIVETQIDKILIGSKILVKQYEVIPLDGIVVSGTTEVDESKLTGESLPVSKTIGSDVMSGSINQGDAIYLTTTELSKDSKYQRIVQLVQAAQSNKAPFIRLADRYSVIFTIIAFTISGLAWIISRDPVHALTVLVVATPCPLILAAPAAFAAGISKLAERGIILKNPAVIEKFEKINVFLFDKTGTLTFGRPNINLIISLNKKYLEKDIFQICFSLDKFSSHILAKTLSLEANLKKIVSLKVENYKEEIGYGVEGIVNGKQYFFGKPAYIQRKIGIENFKISKVKLENEIISILSTSKTVIGTVSFTDKIRPNLVNFFESLQTPPNKTSNKTEVVLVTGDKEESAKLIANQVGISDVRANCLPEGKLKIVEDFKSEKKLVAMVGDGINDAPAIAAADIGIVIGGQNSNATSESGDVIIINDSPELIEAALKISKRTMYIAKQSIFVGIGLSVILMIFGAFGLFSPFAGALMQEGIDVLVILNALRARNID